MQTSSPTATQPHERRTTILVVEDERSYRLLLEMNLRRAGYRVLLAETGQEGLDLLVRESPHLVLLDLRLPDMDGEDVCRRIRASSPSSPYRAHALVPVIMVTARAEQSQKVRGLLSGADDYVTKPFDMAELLARIDAMLRRASAAAQPIPPVAPPDTPPYHHGILLIDPASPRVTLDGREVTCTHEEHSLLAALISNAGRVVLQDELLRRVWGPDQQNNTALLHTAMWRLRKKLEADPGRPLHLLALPGVGYSLASPDS